MDSPYWHFNSKVHIVSQYSRQLDFHTFRWATIPLPARTFQRDQMRYKNGFLCIVWISITKCFKRGWSNRDGGVKICFLNFRSKLGRRILGLEMA
jgi:hypothetical protein